MSLRLGSPRCTRRSEALLALSTEELGNLGGRELASMLQEAMDLEGRAGAFYVVDEKRGTVERVR